MRLNYEIDCNAVDSSSFAFWFNQSYAVLFGSLRRWQKRRESRQSDRSYAEAFRLLLCRYLVRVSRICAGTSNDAALTISAVTELCRCKRVGVRLGFGLVNKIS